MSCVEPALNSAEGQLESRLWHKIKPPDLTFFERAHTLATLLASFLILFKSYQSNPYNMSPQ